MLQHSSIALCHELFDTGNDSVFLARSDNDIRGHVAVRYLGRAPHGYDNRIRIILCHSPQHLIGLAVGFAGNGTCVDDTYVSLFGRLGIQMPIIKKQAPCGVCLVLINPAS